jgi:hypothetical protein
MGLILFDKRAVCFHGKGVSIKNVIQLGLQPKLVFLEEYFQESDFAFIAASPCQSLMRVRVQKQLTCCTLSGKGNTIRAFTCQVTR